MLRLQPLISILRHRLVTKDVGVLVTVEHRMSHFKIFTSTLHISNKVANITTCCITMASLTDSVKYPAITVNNVYCDTIRISKCNINDGCIATFIFNINAGVHGLLLGEIKKQYRDTSYIINDECLGITCDPAIIGKDICVVMPKVTDVYSPSSSRLRRHRRSTLSMVKISEIVHQRPVLMSRVNITFTDVCIYKDSSSDKDTWFVSYLSFHVDILSPMRVQG